MYHANRDTGFKATIPKVDDVEPVAATPVGATWTSRVYNGTAEYCCPSYNSWIFRVSMRPASASPALPPTFRGLLLC